MALVNLKGRADDGEVVALVGPVRDGWTPLGWEDDGRLVACAAVARRGDDVELHALTVALDARRRGIGRALLDAIARVASTPRLVASKGNDFLERCGFEPEGELWVRTLDATAAAPELVAAATLEELEAAVRGAWSRETTEDPERWSEENPALGQCGVTAVLVRELLGGEILVANVIYGGRRAERHAWNRLPSGLAIDLSRSQFVDGEQLAEPHVEEPLLVRRDPERYRLFRARVLERLGSPAPRSL